LFLLYSVDLLRLIKIRNFHPHLYADDVQIYGFCRPGACGELQNHLTECVSDVATSMQSNRFQLHATKTEVLWCSSARRQHQIPSTPITVWPQCCLFALYLNSASTSTPICRC